MKYKKLLCSAVSAAMLIGSLPAGVWAQDADAAPPGQPQVYSEPADSSAELQKDSDKTTADNPTPDNPTAAIPKDAIFVDSAEVLTAIAEAVENGADLSDRYYLQTTDIDLGELAGWTPIGKSYEAPFSGHYNGGGYSITNLNVQGENTCAGLFGYLLGATVENVRIDSGRTDSSAAYMGALAGVANRSVILNCRNRAEVVNESASGVARTGGLVGVAYNSKLYNCANEGTVTAANIEGDNFFQGAGGLAGLTAKGAEIAGCYNTGSVKAPEEAYKGGLAACIASAEDNFTNCYWSEDEELPAASQKNPQAEIVGEAKAAAVMTEPTFPETIAVDVTNVTLPNPPEKTEHDGGNLEEDLSGAADSDKKAEEQAERWVTISAIDVTLDFNQGPCDLLSGVEAVDESGAKAAVAVADDGGFDPGAAGTYTVVYRAQHAEAAGVEATCSRTVTVSKFRSIDSSQLTAANFSRTKIKDMRKAFDAVSTEGSAYAEPNNAGIDSNLFEVDSNHLQGVGVYGDYTIIASSIQNTEYHHIFIYDKEKPFCVLKDKMPFGEAPLVHSGGIQVLGDFLFMFVYSTPEGEQSDDDRCLLMVYDLRPLNEGKEPVCVDTTLTSELGTNNDTQAIGVTNYTDKNGVEKLLMINNQYSVWESDMPVDGKSFNWVKKTMLKGSYKPPSNSDANVVLLTDQNNDVYTIRLQSKNGPAESAFIQSVAEKLGFDAPCYYDSISLHKVTFDETTAKISDTIATKRVDPYDSNTALGSHFRFTGTVDVKNENYFSVLSTSSLPGAFYVNYVAPGLSDALTALIPALDKTRINEYKPETEIRIKNNSAAVAKVDVSYTYEGARRSESTDSLTLGLTGKLVLPPEAADIEVKTSLYTGSAWKVISTKNYPSRSGIAIEFTVKGTLFDAGIVDGLEDDGPQYKITVKTSDSELAGTDSNIYMKLIGTEGTTEEQLLSYGMYNGQLAGNAFERGQTDSAVFPFNKDIGEITGVIIRSDMQFAAANWLPESITIEPVANVTAKKPVTIDIYQWIADKQEHTFYAASAQTPVPLSLDNVKKDRVDDVEQAFSALSTTGKQAAAMPSASFPAEIIDISENHIQGMVKYGDYFIFDVNGKSADEHGYYFVFGKNGLVQTIKAGTGHMGGMDISGDLMVCAENGTTLYDLRPIKEGKPMIKLWNFPDIGGGTSAITSYTDANGVEQILVMESTCIGYRSPMPADGKSFRFTKLQTDKYETIADANNFTLLTDKNNQVWGVKMDSLSTGQGSIADITKLGNLNYQDRAGLIRIDIKGNRVTPSQAAVKEFTPFDSSRLALACHMRFASTVVPTDDGGIDLYSTRSLPGNVFTKAAGSLAPAFVNIFGGNNLYVNVFEEESSFTFKNLSGTVAKADITYKENGMMKSQSTGSFTLGQTKKLVLPKGAENVDIKFYVNAVTTWKLADTRHFDSLSGSGRAFTFEKTVFNPKITDGIVEGEGVQYKVTVKTKDIANAGTDSDIYLKIMGTKGTTDEVVLNHSMLGQLGVYINAFEKNATDIGNVLVNKDIGEITGISLRSDMALLGADWYPEYIEVAPLYNTGTMKTVRFNINEWIADKEAHVFSTDVSQSTQYDVTIKTGDKLGAGTDSNIYVSLIGSSGQTAEREISELVRGNAFEKNSTDTARVNFDKNIGEIKGIVVRSDMKLAAPEWFVDWVKIVPVANGTANESRAKTFAANAWITDKTPRTYSMDPNQIVQYRMSFKTGDKYLAGTDSNIYVKLVGKDGRTTNEMEVSEIVSGNAFERGNTDTITVNFNQGIGELSKLQLRSDMKWASAGWYLDWVKVQPMINGENYGPEKTFSFNSWIEDKNTKERGAE